MSALRGRRKTLRTGLQTPSGRKIPLSPPLKKRWRLKCVSKNPGHPFILKIRVQTLVGYAALHPPYSLPFFQRGIFRLVPRASGLGMRKGKLRLAVTTRIGSRRSSLRGRVPKPESFWEPEQSMAGCFSILQLSAGGFIPRCGAAICPGSAEARHSAPPARGSIPRLKAKAG